MDEGNQRPQAYYQAPPQYVYVQAPPAGRGNPLVSGCAGAIAAGIVVVVGLVLLLYAPICGLGWFVLFGAAALLGVIARAGR